jgi:tRNA pseudouridine38-40 synthase
VQAEVEKALRRLNWQGKHLLAAGRTDTGVHALGQVIAFDLDWNHPPQELRQALNATLPADIVAREVAAVDPRFDPRRHAVSRGYRYQLFCQEVRDPLRERYAWRIWPPVDEDLLHKAAARMVGVHDFRAFGTPSGKGGSTVRTIQRSFWKIQDECLVYEVEADAFLYHMVRRLVMLQVMIGLGRESLASLERVLHPNPDDYVQGLAPPQGLFLVQVKYPPKSEG